MKKDRDSLLSIKELKERGWTQSLITKYLGEPYELRDNPFYRSSPPMRFYRKDVVLDVESTTDFQTGKKSADKRKKSAEKAVNTKRKKLLEYVNSLSFSLEKLEKEELIELSCDNYNDFAFENNIDRPHAHKNCSKDFLNRLCVNLLRHQFTEYEEELDSIFGKTGKNEGYIIIKEKVLNLIAKTYPFLEKECLRQMENLKNPT